MLCKPVRLTAKHAVPTRLIEIWEQLDRAEHCKLEQVIWWTGLTRQASFVVMLKRPVGLHHHGQLFADQLQL